ncbi:hypothetical protein ACP70R_010847 [Stipagrostis hirtigluma subsp. patula]
MSRAVMVFSILLLVSVGSSRSLPVAARAIADATFVKIGGFSSPQIGKTLTSGRGGAKDGQEEKVLLKQPNNLFRPPLLPPCMSRRC